MGTRLQLHEELCTILGSRNVYYQPRESVRMIFPCIVYERQDIENVFANDDVYDQQHSYQITVIDQDPDSETVGKVSRMKMCRFNRHFVSDGMNHDTFTIYY